MKVGGFFMRLENLNPSHPSGKKSFSAGGVLHWGVVAERFVGISPRRSPSDNSFSYLE